MNIESQYRVVGPGDAQTPALASTRRCQGMPRRWRSRKPLRRPLRAPTSPMMESPKPLASSYPEIPPAGCGTRWRPQAHRRLAIGRDLSVSARRENDHSARGHCRRLRHARAFSAGAGHRATRPFSRNRVRSAASLDCQIHHKDAATFAPTSKPMTVEDPPPIPAARRQLVFAITKKGRRRPPHAPPADEKSAAIANWMGKR